MGTLKRRAGKRTPILVDDTFIWNHGPLRPRRRGDPWEAYLFCRRGARRWVKTITAPTKREAQEEIRRFVGSKGVLVTPAPKARKR